MADAAPIDVTILVMNRHFLYLPLYLAQFDHAESGKLPFFGKVPSRYRVEVTPPPREGDRSDKAVFDALMDARLSASNIMFAACDPTVLLGRRDKEALMAASLITSSAFWAVNHDAENVRLVSDLSSFDRILCYGNGTTSHLIARRIAKGDDSKLTIVNSTQEIQRLEELGAGTLAISPEVLRIANAVFEPPKPGTKRAEIVLELCTTKEFSNVLTTALFTRQEVLAAHPELVSGVLAALQCALRAIHAGHPMVKACARHNFKDAFRLDEALDIALRGNVFPETIAVRRDRWQRACEFFFFSQALAENPPRKKTVLTKGEQLTAEQVFTQSVLRPDLEGLVSDAMRRGFEETLDATSRAAETLRRRGLRALWGVALVASGFAAGNVLAATTTVPAKFAMGVSWILMLVCGWWAGETVGYDKPSRVYAAHWASFGLAWWALHELVVAASLPAAHFVSGVSIDGALAGGILTLAGGWAIGAGLVVARRREGLGDNTGTRRDT